MSNKTSLANKITKVYLSPEEFWHSEKLSEEASDAYHDKLLTNGNIITVEDGEALVGYCEYWRLTFEQFGRIVCHEPFSAVSEDVTTGYIAYVANVWIHKDYRTKGVWKQMRDRFFGINKECSLFCGIAMRKKSQPVKVFRVKDIKLKGDDNGR